MNSALGLGSAPSLPRSGTQRARSATPSFAARTLSEANPPQAPTDSFWYALASAYDDVLRLLDAQFTRSSALPQAADLRGRIKRRLDALLDSLAPEIGEETAMAVLVPLIFLIDEQVSRRFAPYSLPPNAWNLPLQKDLFPEEDGGDVFFEQVTELLSEAKPHPYVVAAYMFCLRAGFEGRLTEGPAALLEAQLHALQARFDVEVAVSEPLPVISAPRPRGRAWYIAGAVLLIALWQLALLAIARTM